MEGVVIVGVAVLYTAFFFAYPRWRKWEIARERRRHPNRAVAGLVGSVDEVFHPEAHQARLVWEAQQEVPAPAPDSDGSRPDLASGRIVIRLN